MTIAIETPDASAEIVTQDAERKRAAWTIFDAGQTEVMTRLPRNPFVSVNDLFLQEEQERQRKYIAF